MVVKELAEHFHNYEQLHGIKLRRSGGSVYVGIFLEFREELQMCVVQDTIDRMKISRETKIPQSSVNIIPTSGRCNRGRS
ncbi:MAG: hypothetical protein NTZ39_01075 [Methanoregula sp.]|nr:hypothetical protein [Methanoregula sp.]